MHAQTIEIEQSAGRILSSSIFHPGGRKLLAKGHILREEDVRVLLSEGMKNIWVAVLDENEVPEDDAVCGIAAEIACGSYQVQLAAGGRAGFRGGVQNGSRVPLVDQGSVLVGQHSAGLVPTRLFRRQFE